MKQSLIITLSISVLLIIILGVGFYWFQLRPTQIRSECSKNLKGVGTVERKRMNFEACLNEHGLEK